MELSAWQGSFVLEVLAQKVGDHFTHYETDPIFVSKPESTTRMLAKGQLAIVIISLISGIRTAHEQSAIGRLQPLVEISARRLTIAEQVALAKWDSNAAVEDAPREAEVIMRAVNEGESRGLDRTFVSNFFKDQIEANKIVQYSLLAAWHRAGRAPAHRPIDLATAIRPELDKLQMQLIGELADTADIRARTPHVPPTSPR
jgi:chorismate mutase